MPDAPTFAAGLIEDYYYRTGQPGDSALDGAFMYERAVLRDMLTRLEVIHRDLGVPTEITTQVIRAMLYGSPSPAAAELRMREHERMTEMLMTRPPVPVQVPR